MHPISRRPLPWTAVALCTLVFLPFGLLSADDVQHVYMRDGRVITGRVVSQNAQKVWVRSGRRVLVLSKSGIRRIAYDTPLEQQHLKELERQKQQTNTIYERRIQTELERARVRWEQEQLTQQRKQLKVTERKEEVRARAVQRGSLWRSVAFPGWGQINRGEERKGYIFGGLFLGSLVLWYRADRDFRSADEGYARTTLGLSALVLTQRNTASIVGSLVVAQSANDEKRVAATRASIFQTAVFGLYFVNLVDAILFEGRSFPRPPGPSAGVGPRFFFSMGPQQARAGLQVHF